MLEPVSGYDLKKWFQGSINFYWPATHTQIYRTLGELAEQEFVRHKTIEQTTHPDKKVYSITQKGKAELTHWLKEPLKLPVTRHGLLVQLSFADMLTTEEILMLLSEYKHKVHTHLQFLNHDQQQFMQYGRSDRERILWELVLDSGIEYYQGELKWAEKAIRKLRSIKSRGKQPA
ncbi:MAG: PadR family transcriptional regulator [Anaerolineales bacterium]|nr:PadR family transcriptional regulator [Anaerolineales bacterium]